MYFQERLQTKKDRQSGNLMAEHRLTWNPTSEMYECKCCDLAFGPEITYPANSMKEVEIILNAFPERYGEKYVIENDPASIGS